MHQRIQSLKAWGASQIARRPRFLLLALQALALAALLSFTEGFECLQDDAYITFRYSHNLAAGNGWVFQSGERTLGTTTPLWSLLLASGPLVGLPVEWIAKFLATVCLFFAGFGLCLYFNERKNFIAGAAAAGCLFFTPAIVVNWGNEIPLMVALIVWAVVLAERKAFFWAGLVASLCALTRGEGALICLYLAGLELARRNYRGAFKLSIAPAVVGAVWFVSAGLYFGSPLPNALAAKRLQTIIGPGNFAPYVTGIVDDVVRFLDSEFLAIVLALGLLLLLSRRYASLVLPCLILIGGYWVLNPPAFYTWYFYPQQLVVAMAMGLALERLHDIGRKVIFPRRPLLALPFVLFVLGVAMNFEFEHAQPEIVRNRRRFLNYLEIAEHVASRGKGEEVTLLTHEVGIIGYYSGAELIDVVGLTSRRILEQFSGEPLPYGIWVKELVLEHDPDYIMIANNTADELMGDKGGLPGEYRLLLKSNHVSFLERL